MRENDLLIRCRNHTNTIDNAIDKANSIVRNDFSSGVENSIAKCAVKFNHHSTCVMKINEIDTRGLHLCCSYKAT